MGIKDYLKLFRNALNDRVIALDYPWQGKSRYQQLQPIDHFLQIALTQEYQQYAQLIPKLVLHLSIFQSISHRGNSDSAEVYWQNNYLPGLDLVVLYTLVRDIKPKRILEIGGGHSTAVMRKAIKDGLLNAKITCIDPKPRRQLNQLADQLIPQSLEKLSDFKPFSLLEQGDILFFDGSHLALPNSDVTVFFMEILPFLAPGVVVQIHDIYLPFDYPEDMVKRGYNEQYLLAQLLKYGWPDHIEILFPAYWMSRQETFQSKMNSSLWNLLPYSGMERHGGSFWFKIKH